ncbi:B3 domain-containing transcription factor NGA3 [Hibiscus syriacus]|uniref:B3 domain-containing transcription factor NGA3 n=1 Tax=Hibiscus syriacus TaxID=106335 RepID=A0A6A3A2D6_HIBSY|nr:B3 domain-containing transcription factor NGA1-like [Hibiscus syriacus]KAE8697996.1 B3 domain-containing transcription factor NGA3 [Hibiscus syriacus]
MNFMKEDKGYCNEEHEQNDGEVMRETPSNFLFSSSSSSAVSKYKDSVPRQSRNLWSGTLDSGENYKAQEPAINFEEKLGLMDLSLGNYNECQSDVGSCIGGNSSRSTEKEHMFDKVVTPSDVGKLNRLVIPKQHAEKYFPLDGSSNEKGLILNFEDPNGKSWRFRYLYWNSSQSYVMTKGWSRFVKEKKLSAGDIVSFQRGVGEAGKGQLYIEWSRRPNAPDPATLAHIQLQRRFNFPQSMRWGSLYSMPQTMSVSRSYEPLHRLNYSIYPYSHCHHHHQQQQQLQRQAITYRNVGQYYPRSSSGSHHQIGTAVQGGPMVIDSVPVVQGTKTVAKKLRLFGVNMECPSTAQDESSSSFPHGTIDSDESPHLSSSNNNNISPLSEYSKKGKASLYTDLDL